MNRIFVVRRGKDAKRKKFFFPPSLAASLVSSLANVNEPVFKSATTIHSLFLVFVAFEKSTLTYKRLAQIGFNAWSRYGKQQALCVSPLFFMAAFLVSFTRKCELSLFHVRQKRSIRIFRFCRFSNRL
jgi:hypothetical protein